MDVNQVRVKIKDFSFYVDFDDIDNFCELWRYGDIIGYYRVFNRVDMEIVQLHINLKEWSWDEIEEGILSSFREYIYLNRDKII